MSENVRVERFIELSTTLTAFSAYELRGTGQAESFVTTVSDVVGADVLDALLDAHEGVRAEAGADEDALARAIRCEILSDEKLGPIARNVIKLWYVGIWYDLPHAWRDRFGTPPRDGTFTVSAAAYTEALLWPAIGANPSGAKAPGYASWAQPPQIPAGSRPPAVPAESSGP
jgi:hypothetical protein